MKALTRLSTALILAAVAAAPALAAPESYALDAGHTFPRFSYSHFGYSTQLSRFNKTTGKIVFDKAAKTGSVDITIDTKSVDTGFPLFNEHIQSADFLDTAQFPTATFKSTKVESTGNGKLKITGDLTIKGITKSVVLDATLNKASEHPIRRSRRSASTPPPRSSAATSAWACSRRWWATR